MLCNSKPIIGFEEYSIGRCGTVDSFKQNKFRQLKPASDKSQYKFVYLWKNGVQTKRYIHRMIAEAFISNPENKETVNHKNGIRTDNRIENLEWATYSENNLHASRVLNRQAAFTKLGNWKSTPVMEVDEEGKALNFFKSANEAARSVGGNQALISNVCNGVNKTGYGRKWRFATQEEIKTEMEKINE